MNRRTFITSSSALAALAPFAAQAAEKKKRASAPEAAAPAPFKPSRTTPRANKKGFMFSTFRAPPGQTLSLAQKFQMLKDAGFHGLEIQSGNDQKEVLAARDAAGLEIPSVLMASHWTHPLSDPSPAKREVSVNNLKQALRDAKAYGATSVLLVPAVVNKQTTYAEAHQRSIEEIKKCVPLAEELGVAIALENVWNGFLLSPLEAADYCDSFKSPMVRWHFDVGNVINTGWPEQWAQILGRRIATVHVKEYSRKLRDEQGPRAGFNVELFQGDSDWPAVMAALDQIPYSGWLITEQSWPRDLAPAEYLAHLSQKLDQILVA
ncbi:sugar phosphate isomerase/epimerase family protein [Horticoccus sp. 23ND18S-11]|uniref:sugar phosphate isomerase/epimerase family protein n=1 Tax=Horticoccus sp. 23ND18S-11 TaxID=3391832 RepID=UPI0039C8C8F0